MPIFVAVVENSNVGGSNSIVRTRRRRLNYSSTLKLMVNDIINDTSLQNKSNNLYSDDDNPLFQPYRGMQPTEALPEIFIPNVLPTSITKQQNDHDSDIMNHIDIDDERLWVPQTDTVSFRPLCFCTSNGYYVNLLRVRGSGILSRHKHPGPVHGYVIKGGWKYLEHNWTAKPGSYIFEPPGEIHTLIVPKGIDEMITLFHVTGCLLYCDEAGKVIGADDVFTKLELAKKHYASVGFGEDFVQQFIR